MSAGRATGTDQLESQLFASVSSPWLYSEFDVLDHMAGLGRPARVALGSAEFPAGPPHPLFGLVAAEHAAVAGLARLARDTQLDLSAARLTEHFVRLQRPLPGSGTLLQRTRLAHLAGPDIVLEGKPRRAAMCALGFCAVDTWTKEASKAEGHHLMFNQFCYTVDGAGAKRNRTKYHAVVRKPRFGGENNNFYVDYPVGPRWWTCCRARW